MNLFKVKSVEELKKIGKFKDVVTQFKDGMDNDEKVNTRSWQSLYDAISDYQKSLKNKKAKDSKQETTSYFISKEAEIIFYLIELDGEERAKKLGLTKTHFKNKKKATKWRNNIEKIINLDKCNHPMAAEAKSKLDSIYKEMVGSEE
ncbi:hypothetical protein [Clostridium sp.]|uniref:hypothetical protein n=1 Tax=Clostridium sp. TaxID=1506 RepID=UPI002FCC3726